MMTSAGGSVSFKKRGRIEATFIRVETTNVVLRAVHGESLTICATNLCDEDRSYIDRITGVDAVSASETAPIVVRNEMSRRKLEAAKLKEEAASKHHLAQLELDGADNLDNDANTLANRALALTSQVQTNQVTAPGVTNAPESSSVTGLSGGGKSGATISKGVSDQFEQDIAKLRKQAQEKRLRAASLQKEADDLEHTANVELRSLSAANPAQ